MAAASKTDIDPTEGHFTFTGDDGKLYVFPRVTAEVMSPGYVREHRRRDQTDYFMTLVEYLADAVRDEGTKPLSKADQAIGKECLKALDSLPWDKHQKVQEEIAEHLGFTMGN